MPTISADLPPSPTQAATSTQSPAQPVDMYLARLETVFQQEQVGLSRIVRSAVYIIITVVTAMFLFFWVNNSKMQDYYNSSQRALDSIQANQESVNALLDRTEKSAQDILHITNSITSRIDELNASNAALRAELESLKNRVDKLETGK